MITIVTNNRKNMNYNQRKEKEKHIMQVKKKYIYFAQRAQSEKVIHRWTR